MSASDRWRQIEQLCHDALARGAGERAAFLDHACAGDSELRREVESLLAQQSAAAGFLESAPGHADGTRQPALGDAVAPGLSAGTRLGPYEVTGAIGAGGMGEVYKARDTRLGRTVAIKILPRDLAFDPDRRRRFQQEARSASALSHPHICALYDVGSSNGIDFLVMEYLQGQTLAQRLATGTPIPLSEALEYGVQIADALARAHRQGLVHRDIKPANVMLTKEGVKLLDFGLAKSKVAPHGATESTAALTYGPSTATGIVIGTVPYMAPEQLEGREADARSDIFSFGAVLYEMVSGRRAFDESSQASTMAAIMTRDPEPLIVLVPMTPASLDRLVRQCLVKDPDKRWQSADDLSRQLEWIAEEVRTPVPGGGQMPGRIAARSASRRGRRAVAAALAVCVLAAIVASAFIIGRRAGDRPLPSFRRLTFRRGTVYSARFTADGQSILFSAGWDGEPRQVYSVRYDSVDAAVRDGLQGMDVLAASSGNELALLRGTTLAKGPLAGGAPREWLKGVNSADWSPDGSHLAVTRGRTVEYPIGKEIYRSPRLLSDVRVSPHANLLAFRAAEFGLTHGRIVIIDTAGRKKVESAYHDGLEPPVWTADGREVWFSVSLPHAKFAIVALDLAGRERSVLTDPLFRLRDISRDGRVLLSAEDYSYHINARAPGTTSERNLTWYNMSMLDDMTADGRTIVFLEGGESDNQNQWNAWVRSTDGALPQRFDDVVYAKLSPDGKWLAGVGGDKSPMQVRITSTGVGGGRFITNDDVGGHRVVGWLPDSSGIVYSARNRVMLAVLDGHPPTPITPEGWSSPGMGPDGRHVLAVPSDSTVGGGRMFLCSIDGREQIPLPGVDAAKWLPIGWDPDGRRMRAIPSGMVQVPPLRVFRLDPMTGDAQVWKELGGQLDRAGLTSIGWEGRVHFSADGESYAYSYTRRLSTLYVAEGLR